MPPWPRVRPLCLPRDADTPLALWWCALAVVAQIKLALQAGKANPAPPVGPALGSKVCVGCVVRLVGGADCQYVCRA